jgi:hypothetical protein
LNPDLAKTAIDFYARWAGYSAALPHYRKLAEREPQSAEAKLAVVQALFRLERWADAIAAAD